MPTVILNKDRIKVYDIYTFDRYGNLLTDHYVIDAVNGHYEYSITTNTDNYAHREDGPALIIRRYDTKKELRHYYYWMGKLIWSGECK